MNLLIFLNTFFAFHLFKCIASASFLNSGADFEAGSMIRQRLETSLLNLKFEIDLKPEPVSVRQFKAGMYALIAIKASRYFEYPSYLNGSEHAIEICYGLAAIYYDRFIGITYEVISSEQGSFQGIRMTHQKNHADDDRVVPFMQWAFCIFMTLTCALFQITKMAEISEFVRMPMFLFAVGYMAYFSRPDYTQSYQRRTQ